MNDAPRYSTLRDYLQVMREQRWVIVVITVTFAAIAFGYSARQTTSYRATARLQVNDTSQDASTLGSLTFADGTPEQQAARLSTLVSRRDVAAVVKRRLNVKNSISDLQSKVSGLAEARTNFVTISAQNHDPKVAALLANQFAVAARDLQTKETRARYRQAAKVARAALAKQRPKGKGPVSTQQKSLLDTITISQVSRLESLAAFVTPITIAEPASAPKHPVSPKPIRDGFIGAIVGLTLALLAAFMRDALDRRLRKSSEIREELNLPLIGHVREELLGRTVLPGQLPALNETDLEAFRILRTNVDYLDVDAPPKTLLVTSALPEEGKSTVSMGLAFANVATGKRVLLVECDLRRPVIAKRLGLNSSPGLSDYLAGRAEPTDILQTVNIPAASSNGNGASGEADMHAGLVVITAGSPTPRPAEILGSQRFRTFLASVRDAYDIVVLDTTPLLSVVDALELLPHVDGIVLCARSSQTTRDQLRAARGALDRVPGRPTGVVVTGLSARDEVDYGYYSYAYAYTSSA
jgi:capsular exopolysaccharide synthesis family protein